MATSIEVIQKEIFVGFPCTKCQQNTTGCFVYNKHVLENKNIFFRLKKEGEEDCSCVHDLDAEQFNHYKKVQN